MSTDKKVCLQVVNEFTGHGKHPLVRVTVPTSRTVKQLKDMIVRAMEYDQANVQDLTLARDEPGFPGVIRDLLPTDDALRLEKLERPIQDQERLVVTSLTLAKNEAGEEGPWTVKASKRAPKPADPAAATPGAPPPTNTTAQATTSGVTVQGWTAADPQAAPIPPWRLHVPGLNYEALCPTSPEDNKRRVIIPRGYGSFDWLVDVVGIVCRCGCGKQVDPATVTRCAVNSCEWRYEGIRTDGKEDRQMGVANDVICWLLENTSWRKLTLTVKELTPAAPTVLN